MYFSNETSSSAGKESTCNAGDPGSTPGSGRSPEEGIGYPLQYSWASLMATLVKNLPAMQKTWVWSLGWEDPLEKGKATHSSILAWTVLSMGSQRARHDWETFTFTFYPLGAYNLNRKTVKTHMKKLGFICYHHTNIIKLSMNGKQYAMYNRGGF